MLHAIGGFLGDMLFPHSCFGCGVSGTPLCPACVSSLPPARTPAFRAPPTVALFDYHAPSVRKAVHALKYQRNRAIARILARAALPVAHALAHENKPALLVPIPPSPQRKRQRGWDHTRILGQSLSKINAETTLLFTPSLITKTRDTKRQTDLSRRERLANLSGSFTVPDPHTARKAPAVILLDDVTTTGATLKEAAQTLKNAGVRRVSALTIAH